MRTELVFEQGNGFAVFPVADEHEIFGEEDVIAAPDAEDYLTSATFFSKVLKI